MPWWKIVVKIVLSIILLLLILGTTIVGSICLKIGVRKHGAGFLTVTVLEILALVWVILGW